MVIFPSEELVQCLLSVYDYEFYVYTDVFQTLENLYQRKEPIMESCDWMNVVADFLFQELRDSPEIKQLRK